MSEALRRAIVEELVPIHDRLYPERAVRPAPKPVTEGDRCPDFLEWLRWQPCCICSRRGLRQTTSSDPAHFPRTRIHGDVRNAIPLCRTHHSEQHRLGVARFCMKYRVWSRRLVWAWWDAYTTQQAAVAFG